MPTFPAVLMVKKSALLTRNLKELLCEFRIGLLSKSFHLVDREAAFGLWQVGLSLPLDVAVAGAGPGGFDADCDESGGG